MQNQQGLFILPFDHRGTFLKLFELEGKLPEKQVEIVSQAKMIIYEGFKKALKLGVPKDQAAILVDEKFGQAVLRVAAQDGNTFCLCAEKSGQDEFEFEYGENFGEHIEKYQPNFVKALVRYNPEGDPAVNARQKEKLAVLSRYCLEHDYKFIIEPLVIATAKQMEKVGNDQQRYDLELRPGLMVKTVQELQTAGAKPDIWKIEGLENPQEYENIMKEARVNGKEKVQAIVLGRAAPDEQVEKWLKAGAQVEGVIGFAIGRTIFSQPLIAWCKGDMTRTQASEAIAEKYLHFYQMFTKAQ